VRALSPIRRSRIAPRAEALLYAAARAQLVVERLEPLLSSGRWVLLDRFVDSSLAYQGVGRGLGVERVAEAEPLLRPEGSSRTARCCCGSIRRSRAGVNASGGQPPDRLERPMKNSSSQSPVPTTRSRQPSPRAYGRSMAHSIRRTCSPPRSRRWRTCCRSRQTYNRGREQGSGRRTADRARRRGGSSRSPARGALRASAGLPRDYNVRAQDTELEPVFGHRARPAILSDRRDKLVGPPRCRPTAWAEPSSSQPKESAVMSEQPQSLTTVETTPAEGLRIGRRFTTPGVHPVRHGQGGRRGTRASGTATRSPSSRATSSSRRRGHRTQPTSSPRSTSAASSPRRRASAPSSR